MEAIAAVVPEEAGGHELRPHEKVAQARQELSQIAMLARAPYESRPVTVTKADLYACPVEEESRFPWRNPVLRACCADLGGFCVFYEDDLVLLTRLVPGNICVQAAVVPGIVLSWLNDWRMGRPMNVLHFRLEFSEPLDRETLLDGVVSLVEGE